MRCGNRGEEGFGRLIVRRSRRTAIGASSSWTRPSPITARPNRPRPRGRGSRSLVCAACPIGWRGRRRGWLSARNSRRRRLARRPSANALGFKTDEIQRQLIADSQGHLEVTPVSLSNEATHHAQPIAQPDGFFDPGPENPRGSRNHGSRSWNTAWYCRPRFRSPIPRPSSRCPKGPWIWTSRSRARAT